MAVFACFIRAIGPATHAKMSMASLRERCAAAGLVDVVTIGNTGNLLCRVEATAAALRRRVQDVVDGFGIDDRCEVFVRTPGQMARVLAANPFPDAVAEHPERLGVCLFHSAPRWPDWVGAYAGPERLATIGAHLVVDYPTMTGGLAVEKRIGARMTQRNWRVFAGVAERAAALARQGS